jgi:rare lipoprotein A
MYQFTAAHRTLAIGSWVKVTDLKTERSVVVRINDRGPVAPGRIIDLSYSAARMLAMHGVDRVRLDVLQAPEVAENLGPR